jgi:hypothetical protein
MKKRICRIINISKNEIVKVEKPFVGFSSGFIRCDWCDRQIERKNLYFAQHQVSNKLTEYCAKLCLTCGKEKRGAIYFECFICKREKTLNLLGKTIDIFTDCI